MFSANQNDPNQRELDPNKFLDGVGPIRWLRLFFQTRAATIRQCDATIDFFVRKMDAQEAELRSLRQIAAFMPEQHNALLIARDALDSVESFGTYNIAPVRHTIDGVLAKAGAAL